MWRESSEIPTIGKAATSLYDATKFQKLIFAEAASIFIAYKRQQVKPQTMESYEMYFRYLISHFGTLRLYEFSIPAIQEYQHLRIEGKIVPPERPRTSKRGRLATHRAGWELVNHEVNALSQVLEKGGQWDRLKKWYSPLPAQKPNRPKTLTIAAEREFFEVAASNEDWAVAYLVASLTNNTGASGIEIRSLRLMDIDLQGLPPKFQVNKGKNREREDRVVPLNETAYEVMSRMIERALALGSYLPTHYLFPFRVKRNCYDPTRHATKSWLKKQWKALTMAAGVPWLRPHNLRFQCATRMRAIGVPAETIRKTFGWKNIKMLDLYDEPQIDILYEWVLKIDPAAKKEPQKAELLPQWMPKARFPQRNHSAQ